MYSSLALSDSHAQALNAFAHTVEDPTSDQIYTVDWNDIDELGNMGFIDSEDNDQEVAKKVLRYHDIQKSLKELNMKKKINEDNKVESNPDNLAGTIGFEIDNRKLEVDIPKLDDTENKEVLAQVKHELYHQGAKVLHNATDGEFLGVVEDNYESNERLTAEEGSAQNLGNLENIVEIEDVEETGTASTNYQPVTSIIAIDGSEIVSYPEGDFWKDSYDWDTQENKFYDNIDDMNQAHLDLIEEKYRDTVDTGEVILFDPGSNMLEDYNNRMGVDAVIVVPDEVLERNIALREGKEVGRYADKDLLLAENRKYGEIANRLIERGENIRVISRPADIVRGQDRLVLGGTGVGKTFAVKELNNLDTNPVNTDTFTQDMILSIAGSIKEGVQAGIFAPAAVSQLLTGSVAGAIQAQVEAQGTEVWRGGAKLLGLSLLAEFAYGIQKGLPELGPFGGKGVMFGFSERSGPGNHPNTATVEFIPEGEERIAIRHDVGLWNIYNADLTAIQKYELAKSLHEQGARDFARLGTTRGLVQAAILNNIKNNRDIQTFEDGPQVNDITGEFNYYLPRNGDDTGASGYIEYSGVQGVASRVVDQGPEYVEEVDAPTITPSSTVAEFGDEEENTIDEEIMFGSGEVDDSDFDLNTPKRDDYMRIRNAAANALNGMAGHSRTMRPLVNLMLACCKAIDSPDDDYNVMVNVTLRNVAHRMNKPGWSDLSHSFAHKVYGPATVSDSPTDASYEHHTFEEPTYVKVRTDGREDFRVDTGSKTTYDELRNRIAKVARIPPDKMDNLRVYRQGTPLSRAADSLGLEKNELLELRSALVGGSRPIQLFVKGFDGRSKVMQVDSSITSKEFYDLVQLKLGVNRDFYTVYRGKIVYPSGIRLRDMGIETNTTFEVNFRLRGGSDVDVSETNINTTEEKIESSSSIQADAEKLLGNLNEVVFRKENNRESFTLVDINNQEDTYGYKTGIDEGMQLAVSQEMRGSELASQQAVRHSVAAQGPIRFQEYTATGIGGQNNQIKSVNIDESTISFPVQTQNDGCYGNFRSNLNDKARRGREVTLRDFVLTMFNEINQSKLTMPPNSMYQIARDNLKRINGVFGFDTYNVFTSKVNKHFTGAAILWQVLEWMSETLGKSVGNDWAPGLVQANGDGKTLWRGIPGMESFPPSKPICMSTIPKACPGSYPPNPPSNEPVTLVITGGDVPNLKRSDRCRDRIFPSANSRNTPLLTPACDRLGNSISENYATKDWACIPDMRTTLETGGQEIFTVETRIMTMGDWLACSNTENGFKFISGWDPELNKEECTYIAITKDMECLPGGTNHATVAWIAAHLPELGQRMSYDTMFDLEGRGEIGVETMTDDLSTPDDLDMQRDRSGISAIRRACKPLQTGQTGWRRICLVLPDDHVTFAEVDKTLGGEKFKVWTLGKNKPKTLDLRVQHGDFDFACYEDKAITTYDGTTTLRGSGGETDGSINSPAYVNGECYMKLNTTKHSPVDLQTINTAQGVPPALIEDNGVSHDKLIYVLWLWWCQDGNMLSRDLHKAKQYIIDNYKLSKTEVSECMSLVADWYAVRPIGGNQGGNTALFNSKVDKEAVTVVSGSPVLAKLTQNGIPVRHNSVTSSKGGFISDLKIRTSGVDAYAQSSGGGPFRHLNTLGLAVGGAQLGDRPQCRIVERVPGNIGGYVNFGDRKSTGFRVQPSQWVQNSTVLTASLRRPVNVGLQVDFTGVRAFDSQGVVGLPTGINSGPTPVSANSHQGLFGLDGPMKKGTDVNLPWFDHSNGLLMAHGFVSYGTTPVTNEIAEGQPDASSMTLDDEMKVFRNEAPNNICYKLRLMNERMILAADQYLEELGNPSVSKLCSGPLIPEHQNWIGLSDATRGGRFFPFNQDANPNEDDRNGMIVDIRTPLIERFNPGNKKNSMFRWAWHDAKNRYNTGFLTLNHPDIGVKAELDLLTQSANVASGAAPASPGDLTAHITDRYVGTMICRGALGGGGAFEKPNYGFSWPVVQSENFLNDARGLNGAGESNLVNLPLGCLTNGYLEYQAAGGDSSLLTWNANNPRYMWNTQAFAPLNVLPFSRIAPVIRYIKAEKDSLLKKVMITPDNVESTIKDMNITTARFKAFQPAYINDQNQVAELSTTTFRTKGQDTYGQDVHGNLIQIQQAAGSNGVCAPLLLAKGQITIGPRETIPGRVNLENVNMDKVRDIAPCTIVSFPTTSNVRPKRIGADYFIQPNELEITLNNRGENVEMPESAFNMVQTLRTPFFPAYNYWLTRMSTANPAKFESVGFNGLQDGRYTNQAFFDLERQVASDPVLCEFFTPTGADTSELGVTRNTANREDCDVVVMTNNIMKMNGWTTQTSMEDEIGTPQQYVGGVTKPQLDFTYDSFARTHQQAMSKFGFGKANKSSGE